MREVNLDGKSNEPHMPTQEEIDAMQEEKERIQAGWSKHQERKRRVIQQKGFQVPVVKSHPR